MRKMFWVSSLKGWFTGVHVLSVNLECLGYGGCQPAEHAQTFHCIPTPSDSLGVMVLFCPRIIKWSRWSWELQALIIFPGLFFRNLKLIFKFLFWVWFNILICLPSGGALPALLMTRKWRISQPHRRRLLSARQPWSWWAVSRGSSGPCVRRSFSLTWSSSSVILLCFLLEYF